MNEAAAGGGFEIGTTISARPVQTLIVGALRSQRTRLLETVRAATESEWHSLTRCSQWNVQHVVLHLSSGNQAVRSVLARERPVIAENFDPRTTPNLFIDLHGSEPVSDTLGRFERTNGSLFDMAEQLAAEGHDRQVLAVWGVPVDWQLLVTHLFWDAWLHERDVMLPLGWAFEAADDDEVRLSASYGVLMAGVMAGFRGLPFDTELKLDGPGGGTFRLHVDGTDVRVLADAAVSGATQGDALVVVDALSGRGPEIGEVLDAPVEVVGALSHLRKFLLTPAG